MVENVSPRVDRPVFPDGYGLPTGVEGTLAWADVEARLVAATSYWVASVRPDGRPHVVPRWGVWLDGRFWYDGAPTTVHARNLAVNPACTLHLESGTEVVIVEGESRPARAEPLDQPENPDAAVGDRSSIHAVALPTHEWPVGVLSPS